MAQAVHPQQQRKDLELVFSLQSHYKHFFKNYGDIVGVYDIPSITMQWDSFKSYLLKNSGLLFDNSPPSTPNTSLLDVHIRYVNTSGVELPINTQEDFQYALYTFRERARAGEINHLKLTRTKGAPALGAKVMPTTVNESEGIFELDADEKWGGAGYSLRRRNELSCGSGGDGLLTADCSGDDKAPPDWFAVYMKKFKQEIIQEITKVNTTQMSSNLKKMQAANHVVCPKRRQNKSEHYKRRSKMTYANNMAALENTSCDNTDINTIATTPIIANPQKHSPASSKVATILQQTKSSDLANKQIKLKAKRLVASNINMRGSSDSDTLTVVKNTHASHKNNSKKISAGNCARSDIPFNFEKFVVQRMEQGPIKNSALVNLEEGEKRQAGLDVYHEHLYANINDIYSNDQLQPDHAVAQSTEVYETKGLVMQNQKHQKVDEFGDVNGLGAEVLGEERMVYNEGGNDATEEVYMQTWRLENSGIRSWDNETELQFGWGSIVPHDTFVACPPLKPGESGCVSVFYKIPADVGTYECYYHLVYHGRRFGPFLGFKATVTPSPVVARGLTQRPRTVIASIRPPQLPSNLTMSTVLANHCNLPKLTEKKNDSETSIILNQMEEEEGQKIVVGGDDVVAVIQGVVVREGGVMGGGDVEKTLQLKEEDVLPSNSYKRFKGIEKLATDEQKGQLINADQQNMRFVNENQQISNFVHHPYCDSDSDYDYAEYYENDKLIKDSAMVKYMAQRHIIQVNSDSDNASIISIPESSHRNGSNISAAATIAGSFSSGSGSASEEFVVIPMPKRTASVTLSDCEAENDSCPELELEPECAPTLAEEKTPEVATDDGNVHMSDMAIKERYPDGLPDSMTTALAIALKRLQEKKDAEQTQFTDSQLRDFANKPALNLQNPDSNIYQNIPRPLTAEKTDKEVSDLKSKEANTSDYDRWLSEQQTCPVDLSTNSTKAETTVAEIGAKKCSDKAKDTKQHCAATLCDLCTNIIMKNKVEKTKNRLFVFPEDSPGFEVFSSATKKATSHEDLKAPLKEAAMSETRESLYKKMRSEDIVTSSFNHFGTTKNVTQQKEDSTYVFTDNSRPQQPSPSTPFDFSTPQTSSTPKPNNKPPHPCTFKSSLNLKKRGKETFYDSCSSSTDGSCFVCPSCQCDGLCWRYQGKTESDYRKHLESTKALNADEIRAQMRNLFVQLAELEPLKDPHLAEIERKEDEVAAKVEEVDKPQQSTEFKVKVPQEQDVSERTRVPLFMQRQMKDRKPASKRLKFVKTFSTDGVNVTVISSSDNVSIKTDSGPEYVETLAEQFQTNLRLGDMDEPMPVVAADGASVAIPEEEEQQPVRDVCSEALTHTGCPFKTHLFQEHEEREQVSNAPSQSGVEKLIDAPTPEGSIIEGASAPIENDSEQAANNEDGDTTMSQAMKQQRLIQIHCSEDSALGDNMRALIDMGFPNFYFNLQLLKANDNNIILALERLLPNFNV